MENKLFIPVGIEDFTEIRNGNYYYVDKTKLIGDLLQNRGKVTLLTRPRRFGKTLNMSMLKAFFEPGADEKLFDGLYISKNKELCGEYMGKFPVIFLSLKDVEGNNFEEAALSMIELIKDEASRFSSILEGNTLNDEEKESYRDLISMKTLDGSSDMVRLKLSLKKLSKLLCKYYGGKVIILIDEYDVPLDKAFQNGYYPEMVTLLRGILSYALKTNEYLEFAVLTGCLRVAKESIFTGLNNFNVFSIIDSLFDDDFGFTECEVEALLSYYHLENKMTDLKKWYDGYSFGNEDIYCPWDVLSHTQRLVNNINTKPRAYWINSSGNSLLKRFIDKADNKTRDEIERLLQGEIIEKELNLELTYDEIDNSIENIWSVLFTTGYLTKVEEFDGGIFRLRIPNEEIKEVYRTQIRECFSKSIDKDRNGLNALFSAFKKGNAEKVEEILTDILGKTISVYDPEGSEREKEKYYHAFLTGMILGKGGWSVLSNKESGEGFPDIMVKMNEPDKALVIEIKSARTFSSLDSECDKALKQIHTRHYEEYLINEGRSDILFYAIAFYKKRCRVKAGKPTAK